MPGRGRVQVVFAQGTSYCHPKKGLLSNQGFWKRRRVFQSIVYCVHEVDKYLEDANLIGVDSVRIIHGKGTGALRKAIRSYLQNHRYVDSFQDGARRRWLWVTVVN